MKNKTEIRNEIKEQRKQLDISKRSKYITERIKHSEIFQKSQHVMLFYPTKYELNLLGLLEEKKHFYFPKVVGDDLLVCPNCENFTKSEFNIYEPNSDPINPKILDLIIVPALAVDKDNYRLGYGGGYYDRFLGKYPQVTTLTPIEKEFICDKLPKYDYDIKIDYIISD